MRTTIFALALLAAGCSTPPMTRVPAPAAARDGKTPLARENPTISQRIMARRLQEAEVAQGPVAVEGQFVR